MQNLITVYCKHKKPTAELPHAVKVKLNAHLGPLIILIVLDQTDSVGEGKGGKMSLLIARVADPCSKSMTEVIYRSYQLQPHHQRACKLCQ